MMKEEHDPETPLKAVRELHDSLVVLGQAILDALVEAAYQIIDLFPIQETEQDRQVARSRADVTAKRRTARVTRARLATDSRGHAARVINRRHGTDRRGDK